MRTLQDQLAILRDVHFDDGLSEEEAQAFESRYDVTLPGCFKTVLALSNPSRLFEGCSSLQDLQEWKEEEEQECDADDPQFYPKDVVFELRGGYLALFFRADGVDDPEVFTWTGTEIIPTGNRLSHEIHIAIEQKLFGG